MDSVLLFMSSLGIGNLADFPWPTPPPEKNVKTATSLLLSLNAFAEPEVSKRSALNCDNWAASLQKNANKAEITTLGRRLVLLPISPRYGFMLYASVEMSLELVKQGETQIIEAMCGVAAAFSIGNIFSHQKFEEEDHASEKGENHDKEEEKDAGGNEEDMTTCVGDTSGNSKKKGKNKGKKQTAEE